MTKPRFLNKIIIILAGSDHEINKLMEVNPGLSSRFTGAVDFTPLSPDDCYQLLQTSLEKNKHLDAALVSSPSPSFRSEVIDKFDELVSLGTFANGRDVRTVSKGIVGAVVMSSGSSLTVTEALVKDQIDVLIDERRLRLLSAASASTTRLPGANGTRQKMRARPATQAPPARSTNTNTNTSTSTSTNANTSTSTTPPSSTPPPTQDAQSNPSSSANGKDPSDGPEQTSNATRDTGVSDAIWQQLQEDIRKAEEKRQERQRLQNEGKALQQWLEKCADAQRQRDLKEIERKKRELEERLRREAEEKSRLEKSGRCPMGYRWIRQAGGYRYSGGSHWVADGDIKNLRR